MDEAGGPQSGETWWVKSFRGALAMHREEQHPIGREQAAEFAEPNILRGFVQMGEDGKAIDQIEARIRKGQGRQGAVANESG